MSASKFTIGRLARETGCKVPTIRYYEQIGLLPKASRSTGNQRIYEPDHVVRLDFIRHSRELGFSQTAVRELLELTDQYPERSCNAVTEIASSHLEDVTQRIARLMSLKSELERMIESCSGGQVERCHIIETLADHSHGHCLGEEH